MELLPSKNNRQPGNSKLGNSNGQQGNNNLGRLTLHTIHRNDYSGERREILKNEPKVDTTNR